MKKGQVKKIRCEKCGRWMKPVKDTVKKTYTGYLWRCDCFPKGVIVSIGIE